MSNNKSNNCFNFNSLNKDFYKNFGTKITNYKKQLEKDVSHKYKKSSTFSNTYYLPIMYIIYSFIFKKFYDEQSKRQIIIHNIRQYNENRLLFDRQSPLIKKVNVYLNNKLNEEKKQEKEELESGIINQIIEDKNILIKFLEDINIKIEKDIDIIRNTNKKYDIFLNDLKLYYSKINEINSRGQYGGAIHNITIDKNNATVNNNNIQNNKITYTNSSGKKKTMTIKNFLDKGTVIPSDLLNILERPAPAPAPAPAPPVPSAPAPVPLPVTPVLSPTSSKKQAPAPSLASPAQPAPVPAAPAPVTPVPAAPAPVTPVPAPASSKKQVPSPAADKATADKAAVDKAAADKVEADKAAPLSSLSRNKNISSIINDLLLNNSVTDKKMQQVLIMKSKYEDLIKLQIKINLFLTLDNSDHKINFYIKINNTNNINNIKDEYITKKNNNEKIILKYKKTIEDNIELVELFEDAKELYKSYLEKINNKNIKSIFYKKILDIIKKINEILSKKTSIISSKVKISANIENKILKNIQKARENNLKQIPKGIVSHKTEELLFKKFEKEKNFSTVNLKENLNQIPKGIVSNKTKNLEEKLKPFQKAGVIKNSENNLIDLLNLIYENILISIEYESNYLGNNSNQTKQNSDRLLKEKITKIEFDEKLRQYLKEKKDKNKIIEKKLKEFKTDVEDNLKNISDELSLLKNPITPKNTAEETNLEKEKKLKEEKIKEKTAEESSSRLSIKSYKENIDEKKSKINTIESNTGKQQPQKNREIYPLQSSITASTESLKKEEKNLSLIILKLETLESELLLIETKLNKIKQKDYQYKFKKEILETKQNSYKTIIAEIDTNLKQLSSLAESSSNTTLKDLFNKTFNNLLQLINNLYETNKKMQFKKSTNKLLFLLQNDAEIYNIDNIISTDPKQKIKTLTHYFTVKVSKPTSSKNSGKLYIFMNSLLEEYNKIKDMKNITVELFFQYILKIDDELTKNIIYLLDKINQYKLQFKTYQNKDSTKIKYLDELKKKITTLNNRIKSMGVLENNQKKSENKEKNSESKSIIKLQENKQKKSESKIKRILSYTDIIKLYFSNIIYIILYLSTHYF